MEGETWSGLSQGQNMQVTGSKILEDWGIHLWIGKKWLGIGKKFAEVRLF